MYFNCIQDALELCIDVTDMYFSTLNLNLDLTFSGEQALNKFFALLVSGQ
jgi:hypothetical protein